MKRKQITGFMMCGILAGIARGANIRKQLSGDYFDTLDNTGTNGTGIQATFDSGLNLTTIAATPEPGSLTLLGMAGLGLLARRRRFVDWVMFLADTFAKEISRRR